MENRIDVKNMKFQEYVGCFKVEGCITFIFSLIVIAGAYYLGGDISIRISKVFVVMQFSVLISGILHEFSHVLLLQKFGAKTIEMKKQFLKISIVTSQEKLNSIEKILVSISGITTCMFIGFIILFCSVMFKKYEVPMKCVSFIFLSHAINILPFFGDGKQFFENIFKIINNKKGGGKNE